ncbi:hypothetical protein LTR59_003992 [Friedmanniomyces endolithicus]|nr:hypothetical protein LTR94_010689 [Friedmanniomyces endolithicus]KAK0798149.1 hypothetical protein LTR38_007939 [Friedmanniomyces endolithicus]KAK0805438.1 hypothetical protein LTR59_003992 [Friedmanniomyces endolithicus]KAK0811237.1 hypothetical protein LTR75_005325 [Friedmanniomyces endolithicus]
MNLGQIPGYYYDSEKKKYFKIQANHVAPVNAKHAASNVGREQRKAKKHKVEDRRREKQLQQTVHRSRVAHHPLLAGTSLTREVGSDMSSTAVLEPRNAAFVNQLRPDRVHIPADAGRSTSSILICSLCQTVGDLVSLHMVSEDSDTLPTMVAVTQEPKSPGNLFIGDRPSAHREFSRSNLFTLGGPESSLWSSSLSSSKELLAISGTDNVFIADLTKGDVVHRISSKNDNRDVAWLNGHTVAYGQHDVCLWDLRSSGTATRFHRRKAPITGIRSPNKHGVQLLVSDNKHLEVYDTRMGKTPLLTFAHTHQDPQLQFTVHDDTQLVTAVDFDNEIQTYSLRSGRPLGALRQPSGGQKALYTKLRWLDAEGVLGDKEMVLQACQGNSVVRWSWGGRDDDEG